MSLAGVTSVLIRVHRWLGIVLAPVFLLIILSGAVLALRPIVADIPAHSATVAAAWTDVFGIAKRLHKSLLLGLGFAVDAASWAMLAITVIGPLLAWPRWRNSLIGWHRGLGWCLLPLVVLPPLTAVLMTLGIGSGHAPLPGVRPVAAAPVLASAMPKLDVAALVIARSFQVAAAIGPGLVRRIHEGTWAGAWSGGLNLAISFALFGLTVTGFSSWLRRGHSDRRGPVGAAADILIAHASQTGTAARVAAATAKLLEEGGERVALMPLGKVLPAEFARFRLVLIIAATTGEGDVPDRAMRFLNALRPGSMAGARFALLGLGNRNYRRFCGGAERLREAMLAAGGCEVAPMARADGDPIPAWLDWLQALGTSQGLRWQTAAAPVADGSVELRLAARHRLDRPGAGPTEETWSVLLESDRDLAFRPGDLLRIAPAPGERERPYSIGSSSLVDPRRLQLTVRLHSWADADSEGFGRVSGHLIRVASLGSRFGARIDPHPGFNPPAEPDRPIIMIGAGSGIAPFPGFLSERKASGRPGPAWLLFGNRYRDGDFLWAEQFNAALKDGSLTRLDTAFSRDAGDGVHVQARLLDASAELLRWVREQQAVIYICGRGEMARGVRRALAVIVAAEPGNGLEAAHAEVDRWIAEDRIRIDAFE